MSELFPGVQCIFAPSWSSVLDSGHGTHTAVTVLRVSQPPSLPLNNPCVREDKGFLVWAFFQMLCLLNVKMYSADQMKTG